MGTIRVTIKNNTNAYLSVINNSPALDKNPYTWIITATENELDNDIYRSAFSTPDGWYLAKAPGNSADGRILLQMSRTDDTLVFVPPGPRISGFSPLLSAADKTKALDIAFKATDNVPVGTVNVPVLSPNGANVALWNVAKV